MRLLIATALMLSISVAAGALSTLRCGTALISIGDSMAEVLLKCGEPLTRDNVGVKYVGSTEMFVELWAYNFGYGRFLKLLTFEAGRLVTIENGGRQ
jgi:hypothetical protein